MGGKSMVTARFPEYPEDYAVLLTGCGGTPTWNFAQCLRHSLLSDVKLYGIDCDPTMVWLHKGLFEKVSLVPPASHYEDYVDALLGLIESLGIDLIHPQPDPEVLALAEAAEEEREIRVRTFLPSAKVVRICQDKLATNRILRAKDVPAPVTVEWSLEQEDLPEANLLSLSDIETDYVWVRAASGAGGRCSIRVPREKWDFIDAWCRQSGEKRMIVSEYLKGVNLGWQSLWISGRCVASLTWIRDRYIIRHVSPSGVTGTPDICHPVWKSPAVDDLCQRAVRAVAGYDARGFFSIDLKGDGRNSFKITEINAGRMFTPSLMFYLAGGINFPYIYVVNALGLTPYWLRGIDSDPISLFGMEAP
ncbi:MAG: hypothetical protein ACXQTL_06110 [Methanosarcinales archaeon]